MNAKFLVLLITWLLASTTTLAMQLEPEEKAQYSLDIWITIFEFLDFKSALSLSLISTSFYKNLDEHAWQRLFFNKYGDFLKEKNSKNLKNYVGR